MALVFLPPVIGHRGAAAVAPENTLAGLRAGAAAGIEWVEIDVRCSADGVPVVMHDSTLSRTTDGVGPLADLSADALGRLDAGGWFAEAFAGEPVPTLAAALDEAHRLGLRLNLEIKCESTVAESTARTVAESALLVARTWWQAAGEPPAPLISSFNIRCLEVAAGLTPDWPRGLALPTPLPGWAELADRLDATAFCVAAGCLDAPTVGAFLATGRPVLAYTVNRVDQARALWERGVAAVFSDDPERLVTEAPV